jgi:hypothetical protein
LQPGLNRDQAFIKEATMQAGKSRRQASPVTTARKETNSTAAKVNITVSAISPNSPMAGCLSVVGSAASMDSAAGVSVNMKIDIKKTLPQTQYDAAFSTTAMKD